MIRELNEAINLLEDDDRDATRERALLPAVYRQLLSQSQTAVDGHIEAHADLADSIYELCYGRMADDPWDIPGEWLRLLVETLTALLERPDTSLLPPDRRDLARLRLAAQQRDPGRYAATAAAVRRHHPLPTPSLRPYL